MYVQIRQPLPNLTDSYQCPEKNKPIGCEEVSSWMPAKYAPRAIADPPSLVQFDRPVLAVRLGSLRLADHVHQVAQADCSRAP
jgi:hypothetical protein